MKLANVWLAGERVDLSVADGLIASITPAGEGPPGGTVCPPLAEPHVHLDAALLGRRAPNVSGTLVEGIKNWARLRDTLDGDDVRERALETVAWYVGWGCTRIRTHVDTGNRRAVEALVALKTELAAASIPVELQVVAFPQEGILRTPKRRLAWEHAIDAGCDVVGAIPHFERTADEGNASLRLALDLAQERGLQVDVHCDETDDPGSRHLEVLCAEAIDRHMGHRIVAGHCTAMHSYPDPHAAKVIALVKASGVQVVCNPLDNIVLQGRYGGYPKIRGLTRVDELWAAGCDVGIGHDSVVDPWYRLGTANLVDAAYMLVHAGHLTGEAQMERVFSTLSDANHAPFGGAPSLGVGDAATLLHYAADDAIEVLRLRPRPTLYLHGVAAS
jgi:cytosine/creatinine deaminase